MNYLAHIFLADADDKNRIGNLLGDFVSKTDDATFEKSVRDGILMHRKLDCFTDSHPVFLTSKRRVSESHRRYSGILIDMFYDHFLAKHWSRYSTLSLTAFTEQFYYSLENYSEHLPDKLLNVLPDMIKENWLCSYQEIAGIEKALARISKRISKANSLATAIDELKQNYHEFEADFESFFPRAMDYADQLRRAWKQPPLRIQ